MKIAPLAASLLLTPVLAAAQNWGAGLNDAMLRSTDNGSMHFQKVNLREDDQDMIRLVGKTAPAVVMIGVTGKAEPEADEDPGEGQDSPELKDFEQQLKDFLKKQQPDSSEGPQTKIIPMPAPQAKPQLEHGSGVIISAGGRKLIVTNAHVVKIAGTGAEVDLKFWDGSMGKGTVLGYNERYDLAFVAPKSLCKTCRAMPIGNSGSLKQGQFVMAIGAPFALYQTVTSGIVSFLGRDIGEQGAGEDLVADFIQTSAAINPGNSGGAMVDRDGRLMGINTAIFSPTGASVGIGFATPSKYIIHVLTRYLATGAISPSRIGMMVGRAVLDDKGQPKLDADGKPVIGPLSIAGDPQAGSPAAAAGFKKGDVIVSVDGRTLDSAQAFVKIVADKVPGQKLVAVVQRAGQTLTITSDVASAHE